MIQKYNFIQKILLPSSTFSSHTILPELQIWLKGSKPWKSQPLVLQQNLRLRWSFNLSYFVRRVSPMLQPVFATSEGAFIAFAATAPAEHAVILAQASRFQECVSLCKCLSNFLVTFVVLSAHTQRSCCTCTYTSARCIRKREFAF